MSTFHRLLQSGFLFAEYLARIAGITGDESMTNGTEKRPQVRQVILQGFRRADSPEVLTIVHQEGYDRRLRWHN